MEPVRRTPDFRTRFFMSRGHEIHKLKATDISGQPSFYLVHVPSEKEKAFLDAIKYKETINLEDYGTVIGSCHGQTPTPQLRREMWERYGFEL